MNRDDLEVGSFFTTDGNDIWRMESYCLWPTCTLISLTDAGGVESFGMGGQTAGRFHKITMPESIPKPPDSD